MADLEQIGSRIRDTWFVILDFFNNNLPSNKVENRMKAHYFVKKDTIFV